MLWMTLRDDSSNLITSTWAWQPLGVIQPGDVGQPIRAQVDAVMRGYDTEWLGATMALSFRTLTGSTDMGTDEGDGLALFRRAVAYFA